MGPIEAEKAERTRRSQLWYRAQDGRQATVEVFGGSVTASVKLLCQLAGEPDPFPKDSEDTHMTHISITEMNMLMEKAGFEIVDQEHKWV